MVQTIKFSEFNASGIQELNDTLVGLKGGANTKFTQQWTFYPPGTTAQRPVAPTEGILRFNTDLHLYEYFDDLTDQWEQLVITPNGGGTVLPAFANSIGYYASDGDTISGVSPAINAILATDTFGVPHLADTIPTPVLDNITALSGLTGSLRSPTAISDGANVPVLSFDYTAISPVNYYTVTSAGAGLNPALFASGSDTNISLSLRAKGSGGIVAQSRTGNSPFSMQPNLDSNAFSMLFSIPTITADRTITWRDLSGTVALLSDIPSAFNATNMVYVAKNGSNVTGTGTFSNPYADPHFATGTVTGTLTERPMVNMPPGTYPITEYLIRANVGLTGFGKYVSYVDNASLIELYNDWVGEPAGSISTISNVNLDFGCNLIFDSGPGGCGIVLDSCVVQGSFLASSIAGHQANILAYNTEFGAIGMTSVSGTFISCNIQSDIGLDSSGSGSANSTFVGCLFNSSTDVVIAGSSGSLQRGTFIASPITSSLTLDGTFGRITSDAVSMPYAGITYINGATDAQVTRLGNAVYRSLNNELLGRNNFVGQIFTAPVAQNSSSNITAWNLDAAQNARQTMTENTTLANPTNKIDGAYYAFTFIQGSGPYTLGFGTDYKFGGVIPIISTVNGTRNILFFQCVGTDMVCVGTTLGS